jgi:hypothetical protein
MRWLRRYRIFSLSSVEVQKAQLAPLCLSMRSMLMEIGGPKCIEGQYIPTRMGQLSNEYTQSDIVEGDQGST